MGHKKNALAGIEYHGRAGTTRPCIRAIERLLQDGAVERALILTKPSTHSDNHALLLSDREGGLVAIKSGFASGYGGEGPKGLSHVLGLLEWHGVEIDEIIVKPGLLARLDGSALRDVDVDRMEQAPRVRPKRYWRYVEIERYGGPDTSNPWRWSEYRPFPFALVVDPLADLARRFEAEPDVALSQGHRRLETRVRARLGEPQNSDLAGVRLYRKAFVGTDRRLHWPGASASEQEGRANLFIGAVMAHRNRRAHVEARELRNDQLDEFLLLNLLFRLEIEAADVSIANAGSSLRDEPS